MNLPERISEATSRRMKANQPIWELIAEVKSDSTLDKASREKQLMKLYSVLSDQDVLEKTANDTLIYDVGTSFRSSINDLRRTKHRMRALGTTIFPGGNPKLKDRAYAQSLGVPVPKTYQQHVPLAEITLLPRSILKPVSGAGSTAVFFVDDSLCLHSMKTSRTYSTLDDAKVEINKFRKKTAPNKWILEEAILSDSDSPASDFKAYSFYGVIGLFLEIDRFTKSGNSLAAYNNSGEQIELGPKYKSFPGTGLPEGIREMSLKLSLAAPIPFLRFDFHHGKNGVYLGEITPHPGGTYSGDLHQNIDRMLGEHFADAKARLYIDLLNGKTFPEFRKAYDVR